MRISSITTSFLLATLASVTACTGNEATSGPPAPPAMLRVVSAIASADGTSTMTAVLRDGEGHPWNLTVTRQDTVNQIQAAVLLQSEDHATSYSLVLAPTQLASQLDADEGHWSETRTMVEANTPSTLSSWSEAVTAASVKVGDYFKANEPTTPSDETTYGWCDSACSIGCSVAANAAGAIAGFLACEVALGWTGVGATMCAFIAATAISTAASGYCASDCVRQFCTCTPHCGGWQCGQGDGCGGSCPSWDIDSCGVCGGTDACACEYVDCSGNCVGMFERCLL